MVWKPRVTVATVVKRDNRFLMVEEMSNGQIVINQPAGHLEYGESLLDAACRETLEETGWSVSLVALLGVMHWERDDPDRVIIRFSFVAEAIEQGEGAVIDPDIRAVHWLTAEEIKTQHLFKVRSPLVLESLKWHDSGVRFPLESLKYYKGWVE